MSTEVGIPVESIAYTLNSDKSFEEVCSALEETSPQNNFRVLAIHDVQETLKEKGFDREPLRIIEICNAGFAHKALNKDSHVSLFMPCKFVVAETNGKVSVTLGRPSMISMVLPDSGLDELAQEVEVKLMDIMKQVL
jgi:uncharacterized protein (DUF302 family)